MAFASDHTMARLQYHPAAERIPLIINHPIPGLPGHHPAQPLTSLRLDIGRVIPSRQLGLQGTDLRLAITNLLLGHRQISLLSKIDLQRAPERDQ